MTAHSAADSGALLSVRDLHVSFGSFEAVRGVSFDLMPGQTLAVVGESGSGKSVTALSVMGLVELGTRAKIDSGSILFDQSVSLTGTRNDSVGDLGKLGELGDGPIDLVGLDEAKMRDIRGNSISMIFQEPLTSLNPVYAVGNQVAEAVMLHQGLDRKAANDRALEMFELVRIPNARERLRQYPHEMSGGMRQRVMIAMALSCGPKVLIADEPTTALDVTIQAQILALMRQLREETGAAVLIITHDMGVVAEVADSVVVMNSGRVVESGPVADIFMRPTEEYTQQLLAAVPRLGSMRGKDAPEPFHLVGELAEGPQ